MRCRAAGSPTACSPRELSAALAAELPRLQARRRLRARGLRPDARRDARACAMNRAASSPRCRRATPRTPASAPQDQAQQCARLFRRGHRATRRQADGGAAQRAASSIARRWPDRCASPPPSSASWKPRSPAPPSARSASSSRFSSGSTAKRDRAGRQHQGLRRSAGACSMWRARSRSLPPSATMSRPQVDDSHAFIIEGGRHPVVEQALSRDGTPFVANDCDLSPPQRIREAGRIWLLTGPNMAGKSTFLRQNALIAILAQMGSFVPAKRAHHRHRRPAVLARRRRRRSRARALDLHGRDGGDRGDPQPGWRARAGDPR